MNEDLGFSRATKLTSKIAMLAGLVLFVAFLFPSLLRAQSNLLCNPDLSAGSGDSPQCWSHDPYTHPAGDVTFERLKDQQPAAIEVYNYQPLDSRWIQTMHLEPGWYHFTASVHTENVGEVNVGANVSIMETWIMSRNVQGSNYWEPIGFYLQVPKETNVKLACRLGFYSSENTGRVDFRDLSVVQVAAPGADDPQFKLENWYYSLPIASSK
jgi:hypothetical protein